YVAGARRGDRDVGVLRQRRWTRRVDRRRVQAEPHIGTGGRRGAGRGGGAAGGLARRAAGEVPGTEGAVMRHGAKRRRRRVGRRGVGGACALLAALSLLVSACGLNVNAALPFAVESGSIRKVPQLEGVEITVGSKDFTENVLLAYIAQIALKAAGAEPIDFTNISGSNSARYALEKGQIDLMWEYTGTGWL